MRFNYANVDEIIICANLSIMEDLKNLFKDYEKVRIVEGGQTRQQSVCNGL